MPRKDGTPWTPKVADNPNRALTDKDHERIARGLEPLGAKPAVPFGHVPPETMAEWREQAAETRAFKRSVEQLVKRENWEAAHREESALLFDDKIDFIRGLVAQVKDKDGKVSTSKIKMLDAKDKQLILKAYEQLEKVGHAKVTTTKHEHTHSLADQFKALQAEGDAEIEGEIVE